jgi:hypothetical protein
MVCHQSGFYFYSRSDRGSVASAVPALSHNSNWLIGNGFLLVGGFCAGMPLRFGQGNLIN